MLRASTVASALLSEQLYYFDFALLNITTVGTDTDRWISQHRAVQRAKKQAWLFVTPDTEGIEQFGATLTIQGPNGLAETQFLAALRRLDIGYRRISAGLVQAVIPDRSVTPSQVGAE